MSCLYVKAANALRSLLRRHWLLAGTTDEIQVVDQGVGRMVKCAIGRQQDAWLFLPGNLDKWTQGMTLSQRRILITQWAGAAFEEVFNK